MANQPISIEPPLPREPGLLEYVPERPWLRKVLGQCYALVILVVYSIRAQYARAVLGIVWAVLTPFLFLGIYIPLFTYVFKGPSQGLGSSPYAYPLFVVTGFILWNAFGEGFVSGSSSLANNLKIVRHSPAPSVMLPLVKVGVAFTTFTVGLGCMLAVVTALGLWPGVRVVLIPVAILLGAAFTAGLALGCAAIAVHVRDILQIISTLLLVEFFACPILYPITAVPEGLRIYIELNPLTPFLNLTRAGLFPDLPIRWWDVGYAFGLSLTALIGGSLLYRRLQPTFSDAT